MAAFDSAGALLWYRSLVGDYPTVLNQVGMAASPLLAAGKLIVPMDNVGDSFLAAVDVKYGKNVWKTPRVKDINWVTSEEVVRHEQSRHRFSATMKKIFGPLAGR